MSRFAFIGMDARPFRSQRSVWRWARSLPRSVHTILAAALMVAAMQPPGFAEDFQYVYDAAGQLTKVIDSSGTQIEYVYDATGNIVEINRTTISGLAVLGFSPSSGTVGARVTIQGQGFSVIPGENGVDFGGVAATVLASPPPTEHSLVAEVPAGAVTGPISVSVGPDTAVTDDPFDLIGAPAISSLVPNATIPGQGIPRMQVTGTDLQGSQFSFVPGGDPDPVSASFENIAFDGASAAMQVTVDENALGDFTLIASNGSGSSDSTPSAQNTFHVLAPTDDDDGDGLTNQQETDLGTNLLDTDSDDDGFSDGLEFAIGSAPLDPASPDAASLACGGLLTTGSIDAPGEVEFTSFSGTTGDEVAVTLVQKTGFGGGTDASYATVFSPTGAEVVGFYANRQQAITLPEDGTYLVRVQHANLFRTGTYNLGFQCLQPTAPPPIAMTCGDLLTTESIDAAGEVDFMSFSGMTGDEVAVTLVQKTGFGGGTDASYATVFSPTGAEVVGFYANRQQAITLPEDGTYLVRVQHANLFRTGTYNLGFQCLQPTAPPPIAMTCGDLLTTESIDAAGEVDFMSFSGTTGDEVAVTLVQKTGFGGGTDASYATVFSPTGAEVVGFYANRQQAITLPEDGTYLVRVQHANLFRTGTYNLGFQCLQPTAPPPIAMTCGDLLTTESIDAAGEVDFMSFSGMTGDEVAVTLVQKTGFGGGTDASYATVFSPTGAEVVGFYANRQQAITLPEDGTYLVRVQHANLFRTGTYNLGFQCLQPTAPPPIAMTCGDLLTTESIDAAGEVDFMSFSGMTGDEVAVTLVQKTGFGGGTDASYATVFSPTGAEVVGFYANRQQAITLPEDGTYLVRVQHANLFRTGTYNLGLECIAPLGPVDGTVVCGETLVETTSASGEADFITFAASADDQIALTLTETVAYGGTDPRATLFSSAGVEVGSFGPSRIEFTLPEDGTYATRVNANNLFSTGSFELELECLASGP